MPLTDNLRGVPDLVHIFALTGMTGRIGTHGDTRFDTIGGRGFSGADGNIRQLRGCGVGIDRTVAIHEHPAGQTHKEDAGNDGYAGPRPDDLQGRSNGVAGSVHSPGDHAAGIPVVYHHGSEIVHRRHGIRGHLQGDAFVLAQVVENTAKGWAPACSQRVDDIRAGQIEPHGTGLLRDDVRITQQGQVSRLAL